LHPPADEERQVISVTKRKAGVWLFAATSVVSFIAALIPVVKGEGPNGVGLGSGTVFLVIAIASARRARVRGDGPPAG
jgi:O-antigen ligase